MVAQVVVVNPTTIRSRQTRLGNVKNCKLDGDTFCRLIPNTSPYKLSKYSTEKDIYKTLVILVISGINFLFMNQWSLRLFYSSALRLC